MEVAIFGAGGHGKVILDILLESGKKVRGFLDENPGKIGQKVAGLKILGSWDYLAKNKNLAVALGIGNNHIREKIYLQLKELGIKIITAIHPAACVSRLAVIGEGVVMMPGAVVNASARLEEGVVINTGATVDHDCHLARFSHVWPGAHLAGAVKVGAFSYIGAGAAVIQNKTIGQNSIIGAGAVIINDIPAGVTAVGVPAKVIKNHEKA